MKIYNAKNVKRAAGSLVTMIGLLTIVCFLFGCGAVVTQEAAKNAVSDAQTAIQTARDADAEVHSAGSLSKAEKLLAEAEQALSRKRRQRAYRLADQAEKIAKAAEEDARQLLRVAYETSEPSSPEGVPTTAVVPRGATQSAQPLPQPAPSVIWQPPPQQPAGPAPSVTYSYVFPGVVQSTMPTQQGAGVPLQSNLMMADMQNRIQAALQALEGAQNAVNAARLLVLKIQVEIGLSTADITIQQVQNTGAPKDVVNLIQSWYDQARQAATIGNYENALRFIERVQTYTQMLIKPME